MILGGSALGVAVLGGGVQFPSPSAYTRVRINGEAIYDYVWSRNFVMTDDQIRELELNETPVWDGTTLLLANLNNNLNGGSVENITNPIIGFDVNRRKSSESNFTQLAQVGSDVTNYNDLTAEPNTTYIYEVLARSATEVSEPIIADPFLSDFYNWLLIDPETGTTYIFNLNLTSNAFNNEIAYREYAGYNQYNQYSFGNRDFLSGSISAVVSSEVCNFTSGIPQTVDYLNQLRSFINNKKEKILKSRKGHVLRVITVDYSDSPLSDAIGDQPYVVSFSFKEVGEVIPSGS